MRPPSKHATWVPPPRLTVHFAFMPSWPLTRSSRKASAFARLRFLVFPSILFRLVTVLLFASSPVHVLALCGLGAQVLKDTLAECVVNDVLNTCNGTKDAAGCAAVASSRHVGHPEATLQQRDAYAPRQFLRVDGGKTCFKVNARP